MFSNLEQLSSTVGNKADVGHSAKEQARYTRANKLETMGIGWRRVTEKARSHFDFSFDERLR